MASKKQCVLVQSGAQPTLEPMPPPRTSKEVVMMLQYGASKGRVDPKLAAHLAEMGALFPQQMLDAYRAYKEKQTSDN